MAPTLFQHVTTEVSKCVRRITPEELNDATPCSEWNLKALVNHMVYELLWVPDLLAGKTVAEVGDKYEGDVVGDDPVAAWDKALAAATAAVQSVDPAAIVHLSYADKPASEYITEMASDLMIHGWDVDQSIHCSLQFADEDVRAVYDYMVPHFEEWRKAEILGPEIAVPADASLLHKLLGKAGRQPRREA